MSPLPPELDQLTDGWLPLSPWSLAELSAAGVSLVAGSENKPELATDPTGIATATAKLHAEGLLGDGPAAADPALARRRAELAFLAHGYAGAPGAVTAALSSDRGPDGLGAEVVELNLFPALTGAGELVLGNLLQDPARPVALAAIGTPARVAQAITAHLVEHGHGPDWKHEAGSIHLLTMHARRLGGLKGAMSVINLYRGEDQVRVFDEHGAAAPTIPLAAFASWFAELITSAVS